MPNPYDLEDRLHMLKSLTQSAAAGAIALVLAFGAPAAADDKTPTAVDILFEAKHIATIAAGTELVYKFERKPSDEKLLGLAFTDVIKVKIEADGAPGKKNVVVNLYTGDRARDPYPVTDMDGNPMLIVYLDNAVGHFKELAGGDRSYLKNTFSKSLGDKAKVEPVKISYKGQDVDGYRVSVTPFINDAAKSKMRGFEGAEFSIVLSDKIPGHFAKMVSKFMNSTGGPTLDEFTTFEGVGEVK